MIFYDKQYFKYCRHGQCMWDLKKDLKKLRKMYRETKTIVACYLALSENIWTREVCKYVRSKEHCSVKKEVEKAWQDIGKQLVFSYIELKLNGE